MIYNHKKRGDNPCVQMANGYMTWWITQWTCRSVARHDVRTRRVQKRQLCGDGEQVSGALGWRRGWGVTCARGRSGVKELGQNWVEVKIAQLRVCWEPLRAAPEAGTGWSVSDRHQEAGRGLLPGGREEGALLVVRMKHAARGLSVPPMQPAACLLRRAFKSQS